MKFQKNNRAAERKREDTEQALLGWKPRTELGRDVFNGKIKDIKEIIEGGIKIKESEIVDFLIPSIKNELVLIGGRAGKGGGIERTPIRVSAKMHRSGRRYGYSAFAIVGNEDGIIVIGKGAGKEGRIAVEKAVKQAKLNLIIVNMGCGSWECECGEGHSIPYRTEGKSGSVKVVLLPAPKGIGLATSVENRKLLALAGVKDIWIKTFGNTKTRYNLTKATFEALKNLHNFKGGE